MRPRRAICVSRDDGVRRVVARALGAAGLVVEHADAVPEPGACADAAVVVVDRATREGGAARLRALGAPVVVVGDDLDDDGLITLLLDEAVSHLVEDPADRRLGVTSEKLATGDVFGLEKYLAPGAMVNERVLGAEDDRRRTIDEVLAWAEAVGARKPVLHRMTSVVDELLMNAQREATPDPDRAGGALPGREHRVVVRWAADAETLAISVGDGLGTLRQRDLVAHLRRARAERGRPQPAAASASGGAGLGLYLVLANVASLVVNVAAGHRTEVVCLFELAPRTQPAVGTGVRSLHVFQAGC